MLKNNKIISLKNKAIKAKAKGNLEKAIKYYKNILEINSEDPSIPKEIGSLYNKIGDRVKAIEFYWKALEQYRDSEYYQSATAIAQMLLRLEEDELQVKQVLASLYEKQGLLGDAANAYEKVAELYRKEGDIEGVLESFEKIVDLTPRKASIRLKLAEIYENQGKISGAISELKEVRNIYKEQGRVEEVEDIESRIKLLTQKGGKVKGNEEVVLEHEMVDFGVGEKKTQAEILDESEIISPEEVKESLSQDTEELFTLEENEDGGIELSKGIVRGIEEPEAEDIEESIASWNDWVNLAELYESIGSVHEAIKYYNKAGKAQFNRKKFDKAFKIYEEIAGIDINSIMPRQKMVQCALKLNSREKTCEAYISLYECLNMKGASKEANKVLEKAKKIYPNSPLLKKILGEKKEAYGKGRKVESIDFDKLFEEEVAGEKEAVELETELTPSLDRLIEEFKKKAEEELLVSDYSAHYDLGITYKEMGLIKEAIEEFEKSIKGKSWRLKSLEMIGHCYEELGDFEEAEKIYKLVLSSSEYGEDEKIAFAYHLGNIYSQEKLFAKALNEYKRVARIVPDFADVEERIELMNKRLMSERDAKEENSPAIGKEISEKSGELWNSVLSEVEEGKKEKKEKKEKEVKKERHKISYI